MTKFNLCFIYPKYTWPECNFIQYFFKKVCECKLSPVGAYWSKVVEDILFIVFLNSYINRLYK